MSNRKPKILVVDDDEQFREYLTHLLEKNGYQVETASDGEECLLHCQTSIPDLLVTDIVMPEKEGLEVIEFFKNNHPNVPIIAISGGGRSSSFSYLPLAKNLGARFAFSKPINRERFIFSIQHCLESRFG